MSENTMIEIVERIKSRRLELGYSYQDLADKTGMSKSTLQRYEAGAIRNIPLDKVQDLAKGLNVTPEWLMGWDAPKTSYFLDPEAAEIAQEVYERPELKLIFDASRKVSDDDLRFVADMMDRMRKKEGK